MRYRFANCELDTESRTLTRHGEARHVEPQVLDLLILLIVRSPRVVSKDEIVDEVWKGRVVSDETIHSRINAARRAVGDTGQAQAVIKTLPRRGFRFAADIEPAPATASVSAASAREEGPSLAVLPFANLSGDAAHDHLALGIADQLATTLGQVPWFYVADQGASFAPQVTNLPAPGIALRLGVRYVVAGALQVDREQLRINVRLLDAPNALRLWSSSLTGRRDALFDLQDDLARRIVGEVEPRLRQIEIRRSEAKHGDLTAFDHYLRALARIRRMNEKALEDASDYLLQALDRNPGYAAAHGLLAWLTTLDLPQGRNADLRSGTRHAEAAVEFGAFDCDALATGGYSLGFLLREPESGLPHLERSLALNPNSARSFDHSGWLLLYAGRPDEALRHFDEALRRSPVDEFGFRSLTGRSFALLFLGAYGEASEAARRAHAAAPGYTICHRVLAASLAHEGKPDAARRVVHDLLAIHPKLTLARYAAETRFADPACYSVLLGGLRSAGLPE